MMIATMVGFLAVVGLLVVGLANQAEGFKIAFVGDTGAQTSGSNGYSALALYDMLTAEGVELLVQNGDLDYRSDPGEWDEFIVDNALSKGMELLIASGNHEEQIWFGRPWYGSNGYKARLERKLSESAMLSNNCYGEYGERYYCEVGDMLIIMVGWKQVESGSEIAETAEFMRNIFSTTDKKLKFCTWHKPEGKLNPGNTHTGNYEMQELYEICRENAAIITSGHCHVYGRTKVISSYLPNGAGPDNNPDPVVSSDDAFDPVLGCGTTFSVVAGMGGYKFDNDGTYANEQYFRTRFTGSNSGERAGALICEVPDNVDDTSDATLDCAFKLSTGEIVEEFGVTIKSSTYGNQCSAPEPSPTSTPQPTSENGNVFLERECFDDVEERLGGILYSSSSDLELMYDLGLQKINLLFTDLDIPPGAVINSAHLEFVVEEDGSSGDPKILIFAHDVDDSSTPEGWYGISNRATTSSNVLWRGLGSWNKDEIESTPNIAALVQEVVNRPNWSAGNDLSIILKKAEQDKSSASRTAESSEGAGGPILVVDYTPNGAEEARNVGLIEVQSFDDVEEQEDGDIYDDSSDLELAYDGNDQLINIRFEDLAIPTGAVIESAVVVFECNEDGSGASPVLEIAAHAVDSSDTPNDSYSVSSRDMTTASVEWSNLGIWNKQSLYETPELKEVVQEVVNRSGWREGNDMSIMIRRSTSDISTTKRVAEAAEGAGGPVLRVRFRY